MTRIFLKIGVFFTGKVDAYIPFYYSDFACKCGECRNVCCRGWEITLSSPEYFRLLGIDCSASLRSVLDRAFYTVEHPTNERYAFAAPSWDGSCRLLGENGYCMLQCECGEDVLPAVCRQYPRSFKGGAAPEAVCSGSCEKTVELLMEQPGPVTFLQAEIEIRDTAAKDSPALSSAQNELRKQCIGLMQDRTRPLSQRILSVGARLLPDAAPDARQPSVADGLTAVCHLIRAFSPSSRNMAEYGEQVLALLAPEDGQQAARYLQMRERLADVLPCPENVFENLMVNHMFYEQFPFSRLGVSAEDAYFSFCAAYALLVTVTVCHTARDGGAEAFADAAAAMFRLIEHSDFYRNAAVVLRRCGLSSKAGAAALALL